PPQLLRPARQADAEQSRPRPNRQAARASQPGCAPARLSSALASVPRPTLVTPSARPAASRNAKATAYARGEHQPLGSRNSSRRPAPLSSTDTVLTVSASDERNVKNRRRRNPRLRSCPPVRGRRRRRRSLVGLGTVLLLPVAAAIAGVT